MYLPTVVALAVVATIGYMVGRRTTGNVEIHADRARRELKRAKAVASQLEEIAERIRRNLATHEPSIAKFKDRVSAISGKEQDAVWRDVFQEAENMLKPTLELAEQISHAYEELRQQTNHLLTFTETRTDPLTGVSNRKALDEMLEASFSLLARHAEPFALAIFDIDNFKKVNDDQGHLFGDSVLESVALLLDEHTRETDLVARYGGEEFVVVMPQSELEDASTFAEKIRLGTSQASVVTISGGVAAANTQDTAQSLLARADAALYAAKAAGRNRVFCNTGLSIEPWQPSAEETPCEIDAEPDAPVAIS
ncbi:MAG: GGDEF domain-containing protein [Planctomycetia bacterium]|nr:GGDEF domain-containing protein [Planctomycetia bacterium]